MPSYTGEELHPAAESAFGYTYEEINSVDPAHGPDWVPSPSGAMGTDTPLAVLSSEQHPPLFNYFKQLFAQVTNPPIDAHPGESRHLHQRSTWARTATCLQDKRRKLPGAEGPQPHSHRHSTC